MTLPEPNTMTDAVTRLSTSQPLMTLATRATTATQGKSFPKVDLPAFYVVLAPQRDSIADIDARLLRRFVCLPFQVSFPESSESLAGV
jgi:hypothetical protein